MDHEALETLDSSHESVIQNTSSTLEFDVTKLNSDTWVTFMGVSTKHFPASDKLGAPCPGARPLTSPRRHLDRIDATWSDLPPQYIRTPRLPMPGEEPLPVLTSFPPMRLPTMKHGAILQYDVCNYRTWAHVIPFQLCRESRAWARARFGTPDGNPLPFDPRRDVLVLFGDKVTQWRHRSIRNVVTRDHSLFFRFQQAETVRLYVRYHQRYRRLRSEVLFWPGLKHLVLDMERYDSCTNFERVPYVDVEGWLDFDRDRGRDQRAHLAAAHKFLETFLWPIPGEEPTGVKEHLLQKLETLRIEVGPRSICWKEVRNSWPFLRSVGFWGKMANLDRAGLLGFRLFRLPKDGDPKVYDPWRLGDPEGGYRAQKKRNKKGR
ncbi:hypothetical protein B0H63DRAFT_529109 [Podospora didyma]|uniref:Uncharacterized protein n=1 Tax=Podospora didyma TaxID=330526 RepID=A0AAE0N2Q9_9PEZI|nr:hypothetical protein B0H63DRAFT_529109 [Podospora didyma]